MKKRTGGIESSLENIGDFYLFFSVIAGLLLIFMSFTDEMSSLGFTMPLFIAGIILIINAIIFRSFFKGISEIIKLLKRLNKLPYGGTLSLSEGDGENDYECGSCGEPLSKFEKSCTQCGVEVDYSESDER